MPESTQIACETTAQCPSGYTCRTVIRRCISSSNKDQSAPHIVGAPIFEPSPPVGTLGSAVTVTFIVSEPLFDDPVVQLDDVDPPVPWTLDPARSDRAANYFTYTYTVSGGEGDLQPALSAALVDRVGNQANRPLGTLTLDFTPPIVADLDWVLPAGQSAARPDAQDLVFSGRTEAGVRLDAATLRDQDGRARADLGAVVELSPDGNNLTIRGRVDLSALDLEGARQLLAEVLVRDVAGNPSSPAASRTRLLDLDGEPPQDAQLQIASAFAPVTAQTRIELGAAATGATQMKIAGDVLAETGVTHAWIALQSLLAVSLTPGDGPKTITAVFRDGAFNATAPVSATTTLRTGPVDSAPALVLPAGRSAVKNGDLLGIAGAGEPGCRFVSGRLLVVDGATLVTLTPDSVSIASDGSYGGSVTVSGASDGEQLVLELVVNARGLTSSPASSRSAPVTVDLVAPSAPFADKIVLVESSPAPLDPARVADSHNLVHLHGNSGAVVNARDLIVYGDQALTQELARAAVDSLGRFAQVDVVPLPEARYFLVAVDGAGNHSAPTTLALPEFVSLEVSPDPARLGLQSDGAPVAITFTSSLPLAADPQVTVDGRHAFRSGGPNPYRYEFVPAAGDIEGPGQAVVRVTGQAQGLAAGSQGTTATTMTLDFTPPTLVEGLVVLQQADPGLVDSVAGSAGAVVDLAGGAPLDLERWPVRVEIWPLSVAINAAADGSFAAQSIGDNASATVRVTVQDLAGNTTSSADLINDLEAPTVVALQPSRPALRHGDALTVALSVKDGPAGKGHDLRELRVWVDGQEASLVSGTLGTGDGEWHLFTHACVIDQALTGEGAARPVTVEVRDAVGNLATASASVRLDFTPPVVTLAVPGDRAEWSGRGSLEGAAADLLSPVALVELAFKDVAADRFWSGSAFDAVAPGWSAASGTTVWSYPSDASFIDGRSYEIWIRGVDDLGNVGAPLIKPVVCNTAIPDAPLDLVVDDSEPATIALAWQPVAGASSYRVYYDLAGQGPPYLGTGAEAGDSGLVVTTSGTALHGLPTARYSLTVTAVAGGAESSYATPVSGSSRRWQWRQGPLTSNPVRAVCSPSAGRWVASGDGGTLWYSHDDGATWQVARSGTLQDLVALRCGDGLAIATGYGPDIVRTVDDGATWQRQTIGSGTNPGLFELWLEGLHVVVAGLEDSYLSDDGGVTYTRYPRDPGQFLQVDDMWGSGDTVLAVGYASVLRSADGGASWAQVYSSGWGQNAVWGSGSVVVVVGDDGNILRSDDGGLVFTVVESVSGTPLRAIWGSGDTLLAVGGTLILRSTDAGLNWDIVDQQADRHLVALQGSGSLVLAAGSFGGIFRSTDLGENWAPVFTEPGRSHTAVGVGGSGTGLVVGAGCSIVRSVDAGATWGVLHGEDPASLQAVWTSGEVAVAVGDGRIVRSADAGQTWTRLADGSGVSFTAVQGRGQALIALGRGTVVYSQDLGATWMTSNAGGFDYAGLWFGPERALTVDEQGRVWASVDQGAHWSSQQVVSGVRLSALAGSGDVLVAVGEGGWAIHSDDGGATWAARQTSVNTHLGALWVDGATAIALPGNFQGGKGTRSIDGGATWVDLALTVATEPAIAGRGDRVVVVDDDSIWYSADRGATWLPAAKPAWSRTRSVWGDGHSFYASGANGVLLHSRDGGATWTRLAADAFSPAGIGTSIVVRGTDADTLFALGEHGSLLQYGPP